ncbi:MAG: DUF3488 and transglutaminase-like domain-containing protein [Methylotenera sp.]
MMEPSKTLHINWLLLTLALILALHAGNLPIWVIIFSSIFGIWRYLIEVRQWPMPKLYVLVPITILLGLGIIFTFGGMLGREAGLAMFMAMLSLKLLETKTVRDYMIVVILGYFVVGNLFLFNQSMLTFILSIPPLALLTAALIQINLNHSQTTPFLLKLSGKMLLQSIPLMLVLFVLFPRIPGPLWSLPQNAFGGTSGATGLSNSIKFNQVSQLAQNGSVAFRVKFKDRIPPQNQLYWRGPVLWTTLNNDWEAVNQATISRQETLSTSGIPIEYSITLEPNHLTWLLMLDMPTKIPDFASLTHDYSVIAKEPVHTRTRYEATSYTTYQLGVNHLSTRETNLSLQLENGANPRTVALAAQWESLSSEAIIQNALTFYRENKFSYTLNPPLLGKDSIDDFLFQSRRGFCEHYAISFVYLMRAAGVPARVVTGYQGGEINPNDQYLIVRQSDAHAWAEVWLQEKGWVRIDPTAAIAPERIELGIVEAMQNNESATGNVQANNLPMMARGKNYPFLHKVILRWDSLDNGWNQWVIGYNENKQKEFLSKISGQKVSITDMLIWLIGAFMLLGAVTLIILLKKNQVKVSPVQHLYAQYIRQLKPLHLQPQPHEGALEFAQRVVTTLPHLRNEIVAIAQTYNTLQYSKYSALDNNSLMNEFEHMINNFKPSITK